MAKKDATKSDGAAAAAPAMSSADIVAPVFSADALSKLTQRIQSDFEKAKGVPATTRAGKKELKKDKKDRAKERKKDEASKPVAAPDKKPSGDKPSAKVQFQPGTLKAAATGEKRPESAAKPAKPAKTDAKPKERPAKTDAKPFQKGQPAKTDAKPFQKERPTKTDAKPFQKEQPASRPPKRDQSGEAKPVQKSGRNPMPSQDYQFRDALAPAAPREKKAYTGPAREKKTYDQVKGWKPERTNPGTQYDVPVKAKADAALPKKASSKRVDKEALLKEIMELGGTKEDLALVDEINSDDDDEELVVKDSGSAKDVKMTDIEAFMKEIGLQGGKAQDLADSADEDDEEEEDLEDEEFEDVEEDDGEREVQMVDATPIVVDKNSKLLFPKRPDWHAEPLPPLKEPKNSPSPREVRSLFERAKMLLTAENECYSKTELIKSSDRQFLSQIMQSGTLTDKISALTLICQESPLHTTKTLESLLALAQKKSRSQSIQALGAIKDLFAQGVCLPPNRKLKFFAKQPLLGAKGMADIHLLVWAYEDWLKNFYFEVLKCLEQLCSDQLVYARNLAVGQVYELLKEKPEQEANLLRVLVNKIGDTDKKVASKVSYLLLQLMNAHPAMKGIVIKALEAEVVFKTGNHTNAKYYAIITLNQTVLASLDHDVANRLLDIYFGVFTSLLRKENAAPTAARNATGPNAAGLKAHPKFEDDPKKAEKVDKKINKKARLRAQKEEEASQFEEESNAKLVSAVLTGVNRAFPFSKVDDDVFEKHMDTLFRITHQGNFNTSIQALILIFQVSSAKQAVSDRFYRTLYESLMDQRLIGSSKQALYLNLLFRALKADTSAKRVKAFVKRIMQVATLHQPSFICGVLYLLSELETTMPSIRSLITDPEPNEEDEEEVFQDIPDEDEDALTIAAPTKTVKPQAGPTYDGRKRDPLHAEADRSCLWELLPFINHFHPTVALYAQCLLEKKPMPSKPDLGMHTLTHFLDRFVYRNAKTASANTRGTSIMQPLSGGKSLGMVLSTRDGMRGSVPVNSESFWKKKVEDVVPEEVFFHRYFNLTRPGEKRSQGKRKRSNEDDSDSEEEEIWKALVDSRPELEGEGEEGVDFDDDDDGMLDMSDDDEEIDMDSDDLDLGEDDDEEWDSEGDVEDAGGDAAAMFEAQLEKASAKRQKLVEADSDDDSDGGVMVIDEDAVAAEAKAKDGKKKKSKTKGLPMFASMEDYADMMSDSE